MKKVATFASFFCVHSYPTKGAKVEQGVQRFLFISDKHFAKQSNKSM